MEKAVLRAHELALQLAISKSTLWRWCKSKTHFPQPKKISEGVTVWFADEVQEWLNNQRNKEILEMKK
ncbi:MAG: AlpA family phage regulatory protein [Duodenibacillus massiliensis]